MTSLDVALDFVKNGFSIIPLRTRDKVPAVASWEEYQQRLPTVEEIQQWFGGENQQYNIAIICGRVSGNLIVVDFDDLTYLPYVADLEEAKKKTMVVKTGKGVHIYQRCKDPVASIKLPNIHVDIKAEGGYVVAPPSIHPSGIPYVFLSELQPRSEVDGKGMIDLLKTINDMMPFLDAIRPYWKEGQKNDLLFGITAFFNKRMRWSVDDIILFAGKLEAVNPGRMFDWEHAKDTIERTFKQGYGYGKKIPDELLEHLTRLLPKGGELWRMDLARTSKDDKKWVSKSMICSGGRVYQQTALKEGIKTEVIFTQPIQLVSSWHIADSHENDLLFTMLLGDRKYTGMKTDISKELMEKATTGINSKLIPEAVNACIEYYISNELVTVKDAYGAMGVYADEKGQLAVVLPEDPEHPLTFMPGTEPWIVAKGFKKFKGDSGRSLAVYCRLGEFFDERVLALLFGWSAMAPFSYVLRGYSNFFWPLIILIGPRGTGKTTLGDLFTEYLYSMPEGGPSDVTSDFRLLDFLTGTTLPRKVDETENAHFESSKFSNNAAPTLKDAASRQWVGKRGKINRTKDLYAARTPCMLVGNKIDVSDAALLARSIVYNLGGISPIKNSKMRALFNNTILDEIGKGWGIEFLTWCCTRIGTATELKNVIKSVSAIISYPFQDARREDFYASFYVGLGLWNEFCNTKGIPFFLNRFLDIPEYLKLITFIEEISSQEGAEKQAVASLIDWIRSQHGFLHAMRSEERKSSMFYELEQRITSEDIDGHDWIFFTQSALLDFLKVDVSFPYRNLSEVADALGQFYGKSKNVFYDRSTTKQIGKKHHKCVRIPDEDGVFALDTFIVDDKDNPDLRSTPVTPTYTSPGVGSFEHETGVSTPIHQIPAKNVRARVSSSPIEMKNAGVTGVVVYPYILPSRKFLHQSYTNLPSMVYVRFSQAWSDLDDADVVTNYKQGQLAMLPVGIAQNYIRLGIADFFQPESDVEGAQA